MLRMGLEHSIPISQMEMIRREVQVLILFRSLVLNTRRLLSAIEDSSNNKLSESVTATYQTTESKNFVVESISLLYECAYFIEV